MLSLWIAATLAATTAAGGCRHPPEARTQAALLRVENRWITILEARDVGGLDCLLDDGFTDSGARGTVRSKSEMLAQLPHRPTGALEIRDLDVRVEGRMGYIRGLAVTYNARHTVMAKARFTDIFLHRDGHWMAIAAQETAVSE